MIHKKLYQISFSELEQVDLKSIINIAENCDIAVESFESIHKSYFSWCHELNFNTSLGAIKTPNTIAKLMVNKILRDIKKPSSEISWFDPCAGSGVFVEEIIKVYTSQGPIKEAEQLPDITAFELSKVGIFHCCLIVRKAIEQLDITLNHYIDSGRFKLRVVNTLDVISETLDQKLFDAVVGNPPYVRATRIDKTTKITLKQNYSTLYNGSGDLYFYFIAAGVESLKPGGLLCFISPASFFRSTSATQIRKYIEDNCQVRLIVDFDELNVFDNADIHCAIYMLSLGSVEQEYFEYSLVSDSSSLDEISLDTLVFKKLPSLKLSYKGWNTSTTDNSSKVRNSKNLITLKNTGLKILSGVRPSLKKAFVYTNEFVKSLNNHELDKWFQPCIEGKTIQKWKQIKEPGKKLLVVTRDTEELPYELRSLLSDHQDELIRRETSNSRTRWFALRQCSYYGEFQKPKIIFPDITATSRFTYDKSGLIPMDGTFCIPTQNLALLGVLNSRFAWNYFQEVCSSIGNVENKGRLRLKKSHIQEFPIPKELLGNSTRKKAIEGVVQEILLKNESSDLLIKLDNLVDDIYEVNDEN